MASTETRTGFRLPWVSETHPADGSSEEDASAAEAAGASGAEAADVSATGPMTHASADAAPSAGTVAPRRPTKFLADLARAMRTAAEAEREEILERLRAEAKSFAETIHERSAVEATELRATSDADIVAIRDWSKAEIARIREETEHRITDRHSLLDRQLEDHAARIEQRIEHVRGAVDAFEAEMSRFFESLLAEDDPTRFAALAANLPEPPDLEAIAAEDMDLAELAAAAPADAATTAAPGTGDGAAPDAVDHDVATDHAGVAGTDGQAPAAEAMADGIEPGGTNETTTVEDAAPDEAGEPATDAEAHAGVVSAEVEAPAPDAAPEADAASDEPEPAASEDGAQAASDFEEDTLRLDPRVAALGLTPDFDAAEAEAAALVAELPDDGSAEEVPAFDEATIASRLAGLVPAAPDAADVVETQVFVTGLVSVASIAGFKRGLARLPGVQSVSVSSGPDGEFVFAVTRAAGLDLAGPITTLQGFAARVTGGSDERLEVVAHDPDAA